MTKPKELKHTVRHYSYGYTKSKHTVLKNIALKYRACRNQFYNQYGGLECLKYLKYPYALQGILVKNKSCKKYGLQARQWKRALDEVLNTLKTYTEQWKTTVKNDISKNKKLNEEEKHYLYYILCFYDFIYAVCKNTQIKTGKTFNISGDRKDCLHRYLHSRIRRRMGQKPKSKSMSFTIDHGMYNIKLDKRGNNWLAIMSLIPYKMVRIPLTDKLPIRGNLTVKVLKDRIEILEAQTVPCRSLKDNTGTEVVAIDKGITNLLNASTDHKYGQKFGGTLTKFSDRRTEKNKHRNRLLALYNKYYEQKKYKKARHILKYNLGKVKYDNKKEIERKELERLINYALNQFLAYENPHTIVVEDLSFQSWTKRLSRNQKRHFSSWLKGYLQQRIEFKCQQNGVLLAEINAAYTSQTCPFCGFVHKDNRKGDKFHCLNCGREGDADYFASLNILSRFKDPDIGLYTPHLTVKGILMRRFEGHSFKGAVVETVQPRLQIHEVGGKRKVSRRPLGPSENILLSRCG